MGASAPSGLIFFHLNPLLITEIYNDLPASRATTVMQYNVSILKVGQSGSNALISVQAGKKGAFITQTVSGYHAITADAVEGDSFTVEADGYRLVDRQVVSNKPGEEGTMITLTDVVFDNLVPDENTGLVNVDVRYLAESGVTALLSASLGSAGKLKCELTGWHSVEAGTVVGDSDSFPCERVSLKPRTVTGRDGKPAVFNYLEFA